MPTPWAIHKADSDVAGDHPAKYPHYQGGFIWDFVDQALFLERPAGHYVLPMEVITTVTMLPTKFQLQRVVQPGQKTQPCV